MVLTYTGDCGPASEVAELAAGAAAGAGQLMLTHLWPGTDASSALQAAGQDYDGPIGGAAADLALSLR